MKTPQPSNNPTAVSAWSPLQQALFRSIWIATVISNVGTWMQSLGVAWLIAARTYDRRASAEPRYPELS